MIFADHMYGATELPDWLDNLWTTPEVQRLRQVRLVNTASPTIASLSDVRRFTHLLGVVALALELEADVSSVVGASRYRDFVAAAVLHDIGTPPFGHVLEYLLNAREGWHHETMVPAILNGTYSPAAIHHQIFAGLRPRVAQELDALHIDYRDVDGIIRGVLTPGELLCGGLDIDNIDNVFRMASHLGLSCGRVGPRDLVRALTVDDEGQVVRESGLRAIDTWRDLRRRAYERMLFDESCVSGQAMLSTALSTALESGHIGPEHWDLTDEQLITWLRRDDAVRRFAVGDFFATVFLGWFGAELGRDFRLPSEKAELDRALEEALGYRCIAWVYHDRGTFEKRLDLRVRGNDGAVFPHTIGEQSISTIVGVFTPLRDAVRARRDAGRVLHTLRSIGLEPGVQLAIPAFSRSSGVYQTQLAV